MKKIFLIGIMFLVGLVGFSQPVQLPTNAMPILGNYHYSDTVRTSNLYLDSNLTGQGTYLVLDTLTGEVKRDTVSSGGGGATPTLQQVTDADSTTDNKITINNSLQVNDGIQVGFMQATGDKSLAVGTLSGPPTGATGDYSAAIGQSATASGTASLCVGAFTEASGIASISVGGSNDSQGSTSSCFGTSLTSYSYAESTVGLFNTSYTPSSTINYNSTDRVFSIGNGSSASNRNNALTMLKNGTTTIDTTWSYASDMSGFTFSGLDIPSTEHVRNENAKQTGWVSYADTTYTPSNRFTVLQGDTAILPNNAGEVIDAEIPLGIDSLYSPAQTKLVSPQSGNGYVLRVNFTTSSDNVSGYFTLIIDIGDTSLIPISAETYTFPKGAGTAHAYSTTTLLYSLDTYVANGAKIRILSESGDTEIWNISYVIALTHSAN